MPRKPREIERLLQTKFGFAPAPHRSDDHRCFVLQLDNFPPIYTKVSHSKREIGPKLEAKIARQMRVRHPFFELMMGCKKSRQDYYKQLQSDPFPPFDIIL
jgi:hypothetical protein